MIKNFGFTLLELLVCLAILCALFFCLPLESYFYQHNQIDTMSEEIKSTIRYARNIALLKGVPLTLNPLPGRNDWSDGMILFVDNLQHQYTDDDELIYQWEWHRQGIQVEWKGFRSTHYLTFSTLLDKATCNGTFHIFGNHVEQKKLIVNRLGHIRESAASIG
jgi:prepilin-type N-terminal cleavage/methylation domain-containing protein